MEKDIVKLTKEVIKLKEIVHIMYLSKNNAVVRPIGKVPAKYISIKEASVVLNLAVSTIYSKVSRKELPYYKLDGSKRLYFKKEELEKFINSSRMATEVEIVNNI